MLVPARFDLFYQRHDPTDPRLGQIVKRSIKSDLYSDDLREVRAAILGYPDDQGVLLNRGRSGAKEGPDKLREHLYKLTPGIQGELARLGILDLGNLSVVPNLEESHQRAANLVRTLVSHKVVPVVFGGGNDYAFADAEGVLGATPLKKKIGVINVDAHLDARNLNFGLTSGTPYYRLLERFKNRLAKNGLVEFGIQSAKNAPDHARYVRKRGGKILALDAIRDQGVGSAFKSCLRSLTRSCGAIVVSIDLDAIAQAYAPGVSAPSADGLTAKEALDIARHAGECDRVALFSIYELSPPFDRDDQTARLGAMIAWTFLAGLSRRKRS